MGLKLTLCSRKSGREQPRSEMRGYAESSRAPMMRAMDWEDDYDEMNDYDEMDESGYAEEARRGRRGGRRRRYRTRYEMMSPDARMESGEYSGDRMGFGASRPMHRPHWPGQQGSSMEARMEQMEATAAHLGGMDPMSNMLEDAMGVIQSPPKTWEPFVQKKDWTGIAKMEVKELQRALDSGKSPMEIKKELSHTVAALLKMFNV